MRKAARMIILIMVGCLVMSLILSACGEETAPDDRTVGAQTDGRTGDYAGDDTAFLPSGESHEGTEAGEDEDAIRDPVVDWWKVYKDSANRNCVTLQVSNPNRFPIGFRFDLVYYRNGEAVKTEYGWAVTCVEPSKPGIIYGDVDIPVPADVDRVEIANVESSRFTWKVLDSTVQKTFMDNGKQYFDVTFPESPRSTEIWVALYNDDNGDGRVQAEEFVQMGLLAPFVGIYEAKGEISAPVPDETFRDYGIYCLAFTMEEVEN